MKKMRNETIRDLKITLRETEREMEEIWEKLSDKMEDRRLLREYLEILENESKNV